MDTINGLAALKLATEISKIPDGTFTIAFYPYNRGKGQASAKMRVIEGCKTRAQLPKDCFGVDSENYFLFTDCQGQPKACYRVLIRFIGYSHQNNKLRKVKWQ